MRKCARIDAGHRYKSAKPRHDEQRQSKEDALAQLLRLGEIAEVEICRQLFGRRGHGMLLNALSYALLFSSPALAGEVVRSTGGGTWCRRSIAPSAATRHLPRACARGRKVIVAPPSSPPIWRDAA